MCRGLWRRCRRRCLGPWRLRGRFLCRLGRWHLGREGGSSVLVRGCCSRLLGGEWGCGETWIGVIALLRWKRGERVAESLARRWCSRVGMLCSPTGFLSATGHPMNGGNAYIVWPANKTFGSEWFG